MIEIQYNAPFNMREVAITYTMTMRRTKYVGFDEDIVRIC
jgi:hypothetical protein